MSTLAAIRAAGFRVRALDGDRIGVTPIEVLTDVQRAWIVGHRDELLAELRAHVANGAGAITTTVPEHVRTGVPANGAAPARQCGECRHDVRSTVNPRGGLTSCAVRDDVPLMVPGSRSMRCAVYAPGGSA